MGQGHVVRARLVTASAVVMAGVVAGTESARMELSHRTRSAVEDCFGGAATCPLPHQNWVKNLSVCRTSSGEKGTPDIRWGTDPDIRQERALISCGNGPRHPANVNIRQTWNTRAPHSPEPVGRGEPRPLRGQAPRSVLPTWLKVTARVLSETAYPGRRPALPSAVQLDQACTPGGR